MRANPYIAFEGPIAVGKTTFAKALARQFDSDLLLEEFDGNDFLADFYADPGRWSLATQLWFATARHQQLSKIPKSPLKPVIADYSPWKGRVFAHALLAGREFELFERIDSVFCASLIRPTLVVYLDTKDEILLDRIRLRGRGYEVGIGERYLQSLRVAYDHVFNAHNLPTLCLNVSERDLLSETGLTALWEMIGLRLSL